MTQGRRATCMQTPTCVAVRHAGCATLGLRASSMAPLMSGSPTTWPRAGEPMLFHRFLKKHIISFKKADHSRTLVSPFIAHKQPPHPSGPGSAGAASLQLRGGRLRWSSCHIVAAAAAAVTPAVTPHRRGALVTSPLLLLLSMLTVGNSFFGVQTGSGQLNPWFKLKHQIQTPAC